MPRLNADNIAVGLSPIIPYQLWHKYGIAPLTDYGQNPLPVGVPIALKQQPQRWLQETRSSFANPCPRKTNGFLLLFSDHLLSSANILRLNVHKIRVIFIKDKPKTRAILN